MLKEFTVNNFRLLLNVIFRPRADLNLLIGTNNAGKSTLLRAMHFLSLTSVYPLNDVAKGFLGTQNDLPNFGFSKPTIEFSVVTEIPFEGQKLLFRYELAVTAPRKVSPNEDLEVETERLIVSGGAFNGVTLLDNTRERVRLLHESNFLSGGTDAYVETRSPRDSTMVQRLYDHETNPRANCFKRYLRDWQYYELCHEAMCGTEHDIGRRNLQANGRNLSSVIYHLKNGDEKSYRRLLEVLRKVEPLVDAINFPLVTDRDVFMLLEDTQRNSQPANLLSPGTLRFLAVAAIMLTWPKRDFSPLVSIEEPENGLHVSLLKELKELALSASSKPQVIFSSHAPYLIDLFDDRLDGVFFLKRDGYQSRIHQPDPQKSRKWIQESFPLGEQYYREMLT